MLCDGLWLALLLVSCVHGETKLRNSNPTYADQFNEFDWKLSKAVGATINNNVVISPISVKLVLAMLYEGAGGTTAKELEDVLRIEKGPGGTGAPRFPNILKSLQEKNDGYELDVGMKVFLDKRATPKKSFETKIKNLYDADINSTDFKNTSAAVAQINGWAKSVTKGHISHLLSEADAHHTTLMLLLNAVYFKGLWQYPFSINATKEGIFMTDENTPVKVDFMNGVQTLFYYDSVELKSSIVKLPYEGGKFSMFIMLPDNGTNLNDVISNLTPTKVRTCVGKMMEVPVHVSLPKYNFEFASSLAPVLQKLGISEIFSNKADLRNIADGPQDPVVSNVIQKAAIEVNEQGTVASAVTAVELVNKFGVRTVSFIVSRPFLFFIQDETTNTVIFVGKVVNPVARGKPIVGAAYPQTTNKVQGSAYRPEPASSTPSTSNNMPVVLAASTFTQNLDTERPLLRAFHYSDVELLKELNRHEQSNWIISPSSIKSTLSVLLEGASNNTATQIAHLLRIPLNINEARRVMHDYQQQLENSPDGITIKSGTSLLVKKDIGINNKFRTNVETYYKALLESSDFSKPDILTKTVNKWISNITEGYIPEILSPAAISPLSILLLANAVYFKGDWLLEFTPTERGCFYTPQCTKVNMMVTNGAFKFGEMREINARIVELPYKDTRYSMVIVIPHDKIGLRRLAADISFESITGFLDPLATIDIDIVMPKFAIDYTIELKPILQKMGLEDMFNEKADFSDLFHSGTKAKVSSFLHRARVEVTEKGTVAAGATVAQFQLLSTNNKPRLVVDRPFYFFIRDYKTGFLFEGQLVDALAAQSQVKNYI